MSHIRNLCITHGTKIVFMEHAHLKYRDNVDTQPIKRGEKHQ